MTAPTGRPRGRTAGFRMGDEHRNKIGKSNILRRLIGHAEGTVEMTATQVTAGLALLRKVLPDLAMIEVSGEVEHRYVARLPAPTQDTAEWLRLDAPTIDGEAVEH